MISGERGDLITEILRMVLRILGTDHRVRVSIGLIVGIILMGIEEFITGIFAGYQIVRGFNNIGVAPNIAIGLGITFSPLGFRRRVIPESYSTVFAIIEEAYTRGGITRVQRQIAFHSVIQRVTADFVSGKVQRLDPGAIATQALEEAREFGSPSN